MYLLIYLIGFCSIITVEGNLINYIPPTALGVIGMYGLYRYLLPQLFLKNKKNLKGKQIYICLSPEHKTVKNLLKTKAITVSMGTSEQVVACDYVGIASGNREENKIEKTGWTVSKAHSVNAPIFEELPFALECEVESYDEESCMLVANIKNISCDEKILTDKNKIDVKKLRPITFDSSNNTYIELGDVVGQAFKDGLKLK